MCIDPFDWVDAIRRRRLRFTLAPAPAPAVTSAIDEDACAPSRNFAAAAQRDAVRVDERGRTGTLPDVAELTNADRWILGQFEEVRAEVDSAFDGYKFGPQPSESLYHFAWDEFCDWYVELAKVQLAEGVEDTTAVLAAVLDALLKLLHPVMPFVTEVLWKTLTGGQSLVIADWPEPSGFGVDPGV